MQTMQDDTAREINVPRLDLDPFSDEFLTDPYPFHEQMREAGPVVWLNKYGIWAVARHKEVHGILTDWSNFISSAGVGLANFRTETPFRPPSLILEADPPSHTRARAILARVLSPKVVMKIKVDFQAYAEELVERLVAQGEIDAVKELGEVYPLKVFPDALGLSEQGRENLLLYGNMVFNAFGPRNHIFQDAVQRYEPVRDWIMTQCQRENLRPDGFGDLIYQAAEAGEITMEEAPMLVRSFLSAGVDTTVNGIGNAVYSLAINPDQYAKLAAEPGKARAAFEESLRYESSVQTFFRTVNARMTYADVDMLENDKVVTFLGSANRDPRQWQNPETFDIDRKPVGHVAFGTGIHGCVGQAVARMEGELVLAALAKRVKRIEITGEPRRRLNNTLRALDSLPVRLIPH
ncbi:cytochrome P450 [Pusillimonas sp. CC-YST705]|uniref:Cytochrome P450 n=1 Tax=Mesopusillimonas faecipullorum TaxID=2755040 RepID=A0ABS8CDH7_9BURK|nr:cytochrome P450 [Mesopusillimonas faecipullorum]MCB5363654.1 cytochrome P450 [Mesopusillimonas faecipullorum]